jgi:hypothetical protein
MKDALVGYTGLVGSNLLLQHKFEGLYNSKNYQESYGTKPELLVFTGVPGSIVNVPPESDFMCVKQALDTITKIQPKKLVLISTISVYPELEGNELTPLQSSTAWGAYGNNRMWLEQQVSKLDFDTYVIRPGVVFGFGLKNKFLYDVLHPIPQFLNHSLYSRLSTQSHTISDAYQQTENQLLKLKLQFEKSNTKLSELLSAFHTIGWDSTKLTDSRSQFQFYPLKYTWKHIQIMIKENIRVLNLVSAPISAASIYENCFKRPFENILDKPAQYSNYTSCFASKFNDDSVYIFDQSQILLEILEFLISATHPERERERERERVKHSVGFI